jgi:hypothetical protein
LRIALFVKLAIKATDDSDMYNRAFPVGNALFLFAGGVMSLLRLPCNKFSLPFLAVSAGKDGRVECPCQTVDDFTGIRGSICGLFLFVQTHAPLDIGKQHIYEKVFYADVQTLANTFQRVQGWILNAALNMPNVCGIHVTT